MLYLVSGRNIAVIDIFNEKRKSCNHRVLSKDLFVGEKCV